MQIGCFVISLTLLVLFGIISIIERQAKKLGETPRWVLLVMKFILLVLAGGTLFFGYKFSNDISFKGVAESLYSAIKLFFADGSLYDSLNAPLDANSKLGIAYFALYYVLCGVAVYCTAAAVISLFKNFAALRELKRRGRRKNLCVFSELNERTLAIAHSILENGEKTLDEQTPVYFYTCSPYELDSSAKKLSFVFCEVFEQNSEISYELKKDADKLGALCLKYDIAEVHARLRDKGCWRKSYKHLTRYFLAGENEAENVRQATVIAAQENAADKDKRWRNLAVFALASSEANGEVLNSLNAVEQDKATFFVRRINPAVLLAYDVIADKAHYLADKDNPDKDLTVLVAGMGRYGEEIVKMLCWFYQRRTGGITVHVVDREVGLRDRMLGLYPELVDYTAPDDAVEDARFSLVFHEGVDLFSGTFSSLLCEQLAHIDAAYISLGDDDSNAEAAMFIRRLLDRAHYTDIAEQSGDYLTKTEQTIIDRVKLFAVVHDNKRCRNFAGSSQYNIRFVGNDSEIYAIDNLYNYHKEAKAIETHKQKKNFSSDAQAVNTYNADEYARLSSLARIYHDEFYRHLYGETDAATLTARRRTENKRWNTYMRACGYICADKALSAEQREEWFKQGYKGEKRQWTRGRWHNSIAPYSQKGPQEQANNYKGKAYDRH